MAIIDLFIAGVCYTFSFYLFPSLSEIIIPQLIAAGKKDDYVKKYSCTKARAIVNILSVKHLHYLDGAVTIEKLI